MSDIIQDVVKHYDISLDECLMTARSGSFEYNKAINIIHQSLTDVKITKVDVVENVFLRGLYQLKKEEYVSRYGSVTEQTVIHATNQCNVENIVSNNFDWRKVSRSKYGMGTSFSKDADYANYHSNRYNGDNRAFIITQMLQTQSCFGSQSLLVPSSGADTAKSDNGFVYVKFNDYECLPLYVVYYDAPDRTKSKHHHVRRRHYFF